MEEGLHDSTGRLFLANFGDESDCSFANAGCLLERSRARWRSALTVDVSSARKASAMPAQSSARAGEA